MSFESALKFVLRWEGGFVNHPDDPGGATNHGITQGTYNAWRINKGLRVRPVEAIAQEEIEAIYRFQYWGKLPRIAELNPALQTVLFDSAVNFGVTGAILFLQEALNLSEDGILGRHTERELLECNQRETALKIVGARIAYRYQRVKEAPSQQAFLQGWLNRDNDLKKYISDLEAIAMVQELVITQSTWLKQARNGQILQAADLGPDEKVFVEAGQAYKIHSHAEADILHLRAALEGASLGTKGLNTWICYKPHVQVKGNQPGNQPHDSEPMPAIASPSLLLPNGQTIKLSDPIHSGGHFTWAEATKGGTRIPPDTKTLYRIMAIAEALEWVRFKLDNKPLIITSWYRPPSVNAAVGGASNSRHILGDGVDFYCDGLPIGQAYQRLDSWWGDRGGLAPSYKGNFIHIDRRAYRARWEY